MLPRTKLFVTVAQMMGHLLRIVHTGYMAPTHRSHVYSDALLQDVEVTTRECIYDI